MNKKQFAKHNLGKIHSLWPVPASRTWSLTPQPIPDQYNRWMAERFSEKGMIELTNPQGYRLEIEPERVRQFIKPDTMVLRDHIILNGRTIHRIPLTHYKEATQRLVSPRKSSARPQSIQGVSPEWSGLLLFGAGLLIGVAMASD